MSAVHRLQKWYRNQCDGNWEHTFGVKIETLDNPGWTITIDLEDTSLESAVLEHAMDNDEQDWYIIKAAEKKYKAAGDPDKLEFLISYFLDNVLPIYSNPDFYYEILIPLEGGPTKIWTPCKARMVDEETFEIIEIPTPEYTTIKTRTLDDLTFNNDDVKSYKVSSSIGDRIKTALIETFDGIKISKK
jgi:hypothetical protein